MGREHAQHVRAVRKRTTANQKSVRALPARVQSAKRRPRDRLGSRRLAGRGTAELLGPPFGLSAVEVLLKLGDVHGEVALAGREVRLELGAGFLALLEPLLADLELGLELRLAQVQAGLALLELLRATREDVLALVEGLLLAFVTAARSQDCLLC